MKTAKHPSGLTINFDEDLHRYIDDTGKIYYSVTKVIHSLFQKFDAEKIAGFVARKRKCSRQEVLDEWELKRNTSATFGTRIHEYADSVLLYKTQRLDVIEPPLLISGLSHDKTNELYKKESLYRDQLNKLIPKLLNCYDLVGSEMILFSPEYSLSGTLDLLMRNKRTGVLAIFDWKTNEEIRNVNKHKPSQTGLYSLSHIPDCNFYYYALQLSTYKQMLINDGYYKDTDYELAIFHIRDSEVIPYKLPTLDNEAKYIMSVAKNPTPELKEDYENSLQD